MQRVYENSMNTPLNRRFLWISLFLHIGGVFVLAFFNSDSNIHKKFLVFGAYSKHITHAYFRPLKAPPTRITPRRAPVQQTRNVRQVRAPQRKIPPPAPRKPVAKKEPPKVSIQRDKPGEQRRRAELLQQKKQEAERKAREELAKKREAERKRQEEELVKKREAERKKQEDLSAVALAKEEEKRRAEEEKKQQEAAAQKEQEEIEESEEVGDEEEGLHFNLLGEQDPQMIKYQQCIQHAVEQVWRPPLGVPKGTECTVHFVLDANGLVKHFEIVHKSRMLIYDLSIVSIAKNFKYDRCLWGKSFSVDFRQ